MDDFQLKKVRQLPSNEKSRMPASASSRVAVVKLPQIALYKRKENRMPEQGESTRIGSYLAATDRRQVCNGMGNNLFS